MKKRIVSITEVGEGFISPTDIDDGKFLGSIFIEHKDDPGEACGFVYQEIDSGDWVMETLDSISDQLPTFEELFEEFLDKTEYIAIVKE